MRENHLRPLRRTLPIPGLSLRILVACCAAAGAQQATPVAPAAEPAPPAEPPPSVVAEPAEPLPAEAAPPAPEPDQLSSVLVTAQRREEKLQDVPIAITAVGGDTLIRSNAIKTANDITQYIPNASASATDGRTRPRWFLRGIGTNETAASTVSPIGIYSDEVYLNNVYIQGFPIFDLERVEILRGPQGTLWGKNTTGGAIHYVSKKPTFDTEGYARLTFGSYQEQIYQGAVGGPVLGEIAAARIAFYNERRNGWVENLATGRDDGAVADAAVRAQLAVVPSDDFEALLSVKYRRLDGDKSPSFYFPDPTREIQNPLFLGPQRGRDAIAQAGITQELLNADGASLRLSWYPAGYDLTSITAYERGKRVLFNGSPVAVDISRSRAYASSRQVTQEVRLSSPAQQRVRWIAGAYFFHEQLETTSVSRQDVVDGAGSTPDAASPFGFDVTNYNQATTSYAPFASGTLSIIEGLDLTAGVRWSSEGKSFSLAYAEAPDEAFFYPNVSEWWRSVSELGETELSDDDHRWNEVTYDATLKLDITPEINVYARYAHGFRAGGFVVAADNTITQIDPETLDAVELGAKTEWQGGRLTFNTALFNYDYRDIIVGVLLPIPGTTNTRQVQENAAEGYSRGAELELGYLLGESLRLASSVGLLHTEYTSYSSSTSGQTIDANGNRFTRSPAFSGTLDVEYRLPIAPESWLALGTDWSYRTRQYFNAVNQDNPALQQKGYALGNVRLAYRFNAFELGAFARNVTDGVYSVLATGPAQGATRQVYGLPRTFGASAQFEF